MRLFGGSRRNRVIAAYARTLPPRLARDYGASQVYTPGQIARAIANLNLDPAYAVYAYATFLDEVSFRALKPAMPDPPSYAEARLAFVAQMSAPLTTSGQFYDNGMASGIAWIANNS